MSDESSYPAHVSIGPGNLAKIGPKRPKIIGHQGGGIKTVKEKLQKKQQHMNIL